MSSPAGSGVLDRAFVLPILRPERCLMAMPHQARFTDGRGVLGREVRAEWLNTLHLLPYRYDVMAHTMPRPSSHVIL